MRPDLSVTESSFPVAQRASKVVVLLGVLCFLFTLVMARMMARGKQKGVLSAEGSYDVDKLMSQALAKLLEEFLEY